MVHLISVEPSGDGWTVRSDQIAKEITFRSGRTAENFAKRLGEELADTGDRVEIVIHLGGEWPRGRFICAPPSNWPAEPPSRASGANTERSILA